MARNVSLRAATRSRNLRQAGALLILGVICSLLAWLWHPSTGVYPLGVLVLGIGMAAAALLNPHRLTAASWLVVLVGLAVFLVFKHMLQLLIFYALVLATWLRPAGPGRALSAQ